VENYAGLDVSLELSSVCVVDAQGTILKEAKVPSGITLAGDETAYS
jgi:transposase